MSSQPHHPRFPCARPHAVAALVLVAGLHIGACDGTGDGAVSEAGTASSAEATSGTEASGAAGSVSTPATVSGGDTEGDVTTGDPDDTEGASSDDTSSSDDDGSTGAQGCSYAPPAGAIELRTTDCAPATASIAERLQCALALAAANPVFDPPADPSGFGPFATQGVVHVAFDPDAEPYAGANVLTLDVAVGQGSTFVDFPSNVRLEIDAGVVLAYGDPDVNGQLFSWDGVENVSITRGADCFGNGRFAIDLASHIDGSTDRARFLRLHDVDGFLLEHVHTFSAFSPDVGGAGGGNGSGAPVVLFRAADNGQPPRHGVYRHHSNQGSASGWGPNQIASLSDSVIEDIWTEGGDAIRFETSVGTVGSHDVTVDHVFARNGNVVVAFTPHDASSSGIHVSDVNGVSMALGIGAFGTGPAGGIGVFTDTTVTDACIVAGDQAQDGDGSTMASVAAVRIQIAEGADVTTADVRRSGDFTAGAPGGVDDPRCDADAAAAGFEDWWMPLPRAGG